MDIFGVKKRTALVETLQAEVEKLRNEKAVACVGLDDNPRGSNYRTSGYQLFIDSYEVTPSLLGDSGIRAETVEYIYNLVAIYASCVDGISREISNNKISVVPAYENANGSKEDKARIEELFRFPNANKQGFSSFMYELSEDTLNFGKNVIEKCYPRKQPDLLLELWTRSSDTFLEDRNKHGLIKGYTQRIGVGDEDVVKFKSDEIVMMQYNSRARNHQGKPMLEGILSDCNVIIKAMDFIIRTFDYNEIPPGILWLKGATQEQITEIKNKMKEKREAGNIEFFISLIGGNFELVQWIDLKQSLKDLNMLEHVNSSERRIYNRFGVTSVDVNDIKDVNRATSVVMEGIRQSKLIKPITKIIEDAFNCEIVWSDISDKWMIKLEPQAERTREQINVENATLIPLGVKSRNQARQDLNYDTVIGGDELTLEIGSRIVRVRDLPTGELNPQLNPYTDPNSEKPNESRDEDGEEGFNEKDYSEKAIKVIKYIFDNNIKTINVKKALMDERKLVKAYKEIWDRRKNLFLSNITKSYFRDRKIGNDVSLTMAHLFKKMEIEAKPILKKSFEIGVKKSKKDDPSLKVDKKFLDSYFKEKFSHHLTVIDSILLDNSYPDSRSFKNTIRKAVKKFEDGVRVQKQEKEEDENNEFYLLLALAYATIEKRLPGYAAQTWAFQHWGYYGLMLKADDAEVANLEWVNVSDNICVDCIKLADESPYSAKNLPTVPRGGDTACGDDCFCFIEKRKE